MVLYQGKIIWLAELLFRIERSCSEGVNSDVMY